MYFITIAAAKVDRPPRSIKTIINWCIYYRLVRLNYKLLMAAKFFFFNNKLHDNGAIPYRSGNNVIYFDMK